MALLPIVPFLRPDGFGNRGPRSYTVGRDKKPQDLPVELMRHIALQVGATAVIAPNTALEIEQLHDLSVRGVPDLECIRCLDDKAGVDELCNLLSDLACNDPQAHICPFCNSPALHGQAWTTGLCGHAAHESCLHSRRSPLSPGCDNIPCPCCHADFVPSRTFFYGGSSDGDAVPTLSGTTSGTGGAGKHDSCTHPPPRHVFQLLYDPRQGHSRSK